MSGIFNILSKRKNHGCKHFLFYIICGAVFITETLNAQLTGLVENFENNDLSAWEVPVDQSAGTFTINIIDSMLHIAYNRNAGSYEWDNFNFIPPLVDASNSPSMSIRIKSDVNTVFTIKPIYENGGDGWMQANLLSDGNWHNYNFPFNGSAPYVVNRIYFYLDGGTTTVKSGNVYFSEIRIGDSVTVESSSDYAELELAVQKAQLLYDHGVEGSDEGQFEPGSKADLLSAIQLAQTVLQNSSTTPQELKTAIWNLYDSCVTFETKSRANNPGINDEKATRETKYLYLNLMAKAKDYLIFGMHDATGYGVGWSGDDDRSDVKDVCGSYPALYSEDMNKVERDYQVERMRYRLTSAYNRGGIITMSWHQYDPQGRGFYAQDVNYERIVETLLSGGRQHQYYINKLRKIALFLKSLRGEKGESIPVIFRPYHEHLGDWFWWGPAYTTSSEYNAIWQFTETYLRDSLNVHNLIYALSPSLNHVDREDEYFNVYPGDDYVDIFGVDQYFASTIGSGDVIQFQNGVKQIAVHAIERNKLPALTEIGQEALPTSDFFTRAILNPLKNDSLATLFSYAAVWRNASATHHFAPYPGHPTVPDFLKFYKDPYTLFEDNLPPMYVLSSADTTPPQIANYPDSIFTAVDTLVTIEATTNKRAFLRYSLVDEDYDHMPFDFDLGQGTLYHTAIIPVEQGHSYNFFIRAVDYYGNKNTESIIISFSVDTLLRPVYWYDPEYPDTSWSYESAPFVFNASADQQTEILPSRTTYFRHPFQIDNAASYSQLVAIVNYKNGFVIYLNGRQVHRQNMWEGEINYFTWANDASGGVKSVTLDKNDLAYLKNDQNLLAVEVHQAETDSTDMIFDLKLISPDILIDFNDDWSNYSEGREPESTTNGAIGIYEIKSILPKTSVLLSNYPNPFNPSTNIPFALARSGRVQIIIYDAGGRRIVQLLDKQMLRGFHSIVFNASILASGSYFYQIRQGKYVETKKMLLIK